MNFRRRETGDDLHVELTPLIDVVFLLLIFFMVTTTFASRSGIGVKLPEAHAKERPADHVVELTLTKAGETYLDRKRVAPGGLEAALKRLAPAHAGEVVVIRADREVHHGRVVAAMDAARAAGFRRLAIATRTPR
ncbi:MAG: biopolymer transporter ExbD [Nitrospirae bacterium]|nr:MAG: biopolymer transporter ExbD [Nitrospirota bacterium]